uniref:ATP-dependent RNA helicase n=1 Tax=Ornithodoros turicata TaxID=34597 RepID=A0A2R5LDC3_9ACAR
MDQLYIVNRFKAQEDLTETQKVIDPQRRLRKLLKQASEKQEASRHFPKTHDVPSELTTPDSAITTKPKKRKRDPQDCTDNIHSTLKKTHEDDGASTVPSENNVHSEGNVEKPKKKKRKTAGKDNKITTQISEQVPTHSTKEGEQNCADGASEIHAESLKASDSTKPLVSSEAETEIKDKKTRTRSKKKLKQNKEKASPVQNGELFPVLGDMSAKLGDTVKRVLPDWLSNPEVIEPSVSKAKKSTARIGAHSGMLSSEMLSTLSANSIKRLFPVQEKVIPWLLSSAQQRSFIPPRDVCVSAPTGSGKTLAYVIPIVESLRSRVVRSIRAVVVLPVRELAAQVFQVFSKYVRGTTLKVQLLTASKPLAEEQALIVRKGVRGYQSLVDIVVTTPHRLFDHLQRTPGFSLQQLRFFILDEADRVVEDIRRTLIPQVEAAVFGDDKGNCCCYGEHRCQRLYSQPLTACSLQHCRQPVQKLLYSATLTQDPEKLQSLMLFHPTLFTASASQQQPAGMFGGKYTTPQGLTEFYYSVKDATKPLAVWNLVAKNGYHGTLCFTASREEAHRLSLVLNFMGDIEAREFSADLSTADRAKVLRTFAAGKIDVLVCSTVLARGLDIHNVQNVICYDPPKYIKTYVHQVGRTARAGKPGTAITLMRAGQVARFRDMLSSVGKEDVKCMDIEEGTLSPFHQKYREALNRAQEVISEESQKRKDSKKPKFAKKNKMPASAFGKKKISHNLTERNQKLRRER